MPTLVWFISQDAPEELCREMRRIGYSNLRELMPVLLRAQEQGWVTILGSVKQGPEDVAAVIQEHFNATTIRCRQISKSTARKKRNKKNGK